MVNGTAISTATVDTLVNDYLAAQNASGAADGSIAVGLIDGDIYRGVLSTLVGIEIETNALADAGTPLTQANLDAATQELSTRQGFADATPALVDFVARGLALQPLFEAKFGTLNDYVAKTQPDVLIDPRYGYWDATAAAVVPMQL